VTASRPKKISAPVKKENILNQYRSYTYNFTLAAVKRTDVGFPDRYMTPSLELVVLKSGGKGNGAINPDSALGTTTKLNSRLSTDDDGNSNEIFINAEAGKQLVKDFNERSPGKFDMYMDNLQISTTFTHTEIATTSLSFKLSFDVIEPYSMAGFLEALQVAAVAAGYPSYGQASFVLKLEFKGYPDSANITNPEVVPKSTRYFLMKITGVETEVTERGTIYRCKAFSWSDQGHGEANTLKAPIPMRGNTVQKMLENLMENLNSQISDSDSLGKSNLPTGAHNRYFIEFPNRDSNGQLLAYDPADPNEMGLADVIDFTKGVPFLSFEDIGTTNKPNTYKIKDSGSDNSKSSSPPSFYQVQFREQSKIHEIISAVIRDSTYTSKLLKSVKRDEYGMITYFMIKLKITNQPQYDSVARNPFKDYTYVVVPYKIHFTRIPAYGADRFDATKYKERVLRTYNYIYTGKNLDILNFKINYNYLYQEALAKQAGNTLTPTSKDTALKLTSADEQEEKVVGVDLGSLSPNRNSAYTVPVNVQTAVGGNATQPGTDQYLAMSRLFHEALVNSSSGLITGKLEILGDPFYLVMDGTSSYDPKLEPDGTTTFGDANFLSGESWININFRNPYDIQPLDQGGTMLFKPELTPFSGIYRINTIQHSFNEGVFKQTLNIVRMVGQIQGKETPTNPDNRLISDTNPNEAERQAADNIIRPAP
jgi:hypothetical protein